jgi:hypothetical protein
MDYWNSQQDQCLQALLEAFNLRGYKTIVDLGGIYTSIHTVLC